MPLPSVTSTYTGAPASAPTSASKRILAIIGEGLKTFTITESVRRFALAAPGSVAAANEGASGATSYSYNVTSVTAGGESVVSTVATTATGNATLDGTNYNQVTWAAVVGATAYNVYRTASGGTPSSTGLIGRTTALLFNDQGLAGTGAAPAGSTDYLANPPTAIGRVGNYSTTTDYAASTDYNMSALGLTYVTGHGPAASAGYWVTYTYAKTDFTPKYFQNDFRGITAAYGPITSNINPGVLDPASQLTMAAAVAMGPGIAASQLILVQINPSTPGTPLLADFTAAYTALQGPVGSPPVNPYYIVPLVGNLSDGDAASAIASALAHSVQMADPSFRLERRAYCGMKSNATYSTLIAELEALNGANHSERITLAANFDPQVTIVNNGVATTVTLDGSYVAVALAAYRSTQQVSMPMIGAQVQAFSGFTTNFGPGPGDNIDDVGGTILENSSGVITVANDVTCNVSSDIEKSIPTVETRDDLIIGCRLQLKRNVLGQRGSPVVPSDIEHEVDIYLKTRLTAGDISGASPSSAKLNSGSTTKYTVTFSYNPAGEVLSINVSFSIDTSLA
jgi:hypothetical protein